MDDSSAPDVILYQEKNVFFPDFLELVRAYGELCTRFLALEAKSGGVSAESSSSSSSEPPASEPAASESSASEPASTEPVKPEASNPSEVEPPAAASEPAAS